MSGIKYLVRRPVLKFWGRRRKNTKLFVKTAPHSVTVGLMVNIHRSTSHFMQDIANNTKQCSVVLLSYG